MVLSECLYILDNIYIRFGTKLYGQIVGIPMRTNCGSLVAYMFLFCHERDFMSSLSDDNQSDIMEAFNSNKNTKVRSFKRSQNIQTKECGSVSNYKLSSVTPNELAMKARESIQ